MKHDQLIALDAIVITGTFRGAAERLHKSQSAISHTIRQLEEELELELLSREAYRPALTPAGEIFYREASRVLRQMQGLRSTAARLRAREEPELTVAVSATMDLDPLLPALAETGRRHPATHLRLRMEMMGGPIARLMEGKADIALASLDGVPLDEVEAEPVAEVTIRPVASPDLGLPSGSRALSASEMQGHVQVVAAGTGGAAHEQSRDLLSGGLKWTVSDLTAKKKVILAGLGWGGLPDHMTDAERRSGALLSLNLEGFPLRRTMLYKMRRRDQTVGVVANELWSKIGTAKPD
ncbi:MULTISPECIES: LysR family transcriptional regulator [unclassified Leisingera]|uniref:LysR family transcriptional regulator n=1 Tax=unclassified Leisingera TaxID=2614906 RepID=UPI00031CF352|nr:MULTISPECIES: LysR family transcriptional regulator [unclassified Leisingera]KIC17458.1 LysR family transcriptional regulator [Leisingera sp. ANG-DT]KIC22923.1 LysR family transcriptional regulator [Leisingera sp. ANG-S3]KIC27109.1 LysR family transcriptional regulator [Leisingera sp. ANG-M6]KIC32335.1 LysR family transcriptional regulator [Leisingera sp. ANG-S5]KIC52252.1 LysR family transcriptional regulator [Leisingera sp. ANG-S]